ncbi:MAG: PQQ-binding-like beta-propeller repeat protein [Phycisphaerae bacterium]
MTGNRIVRGQLGCLGIVCALALAGWLPQQGYGQIIMAGRPSPSDSSGKTRPMPLVNSDPELSTFFSKVESLIDEKAYADAIRLLDEVSAKAAEMGYIEADSSGRLFKTVMSRVNELLKGMGPEGLALYRAMHDSEAQKAYEDGLANCDPVALQRVATTYLYTSYGGPALDALGAMHFDAGRFYQAGYCWRQLIQADGQSPAVAPLLAKSAVAFYAAGEKEPSDQALAVLKKDFPQATAAFGGKDENLVQFVERVRSKPISISSVARSQAFKGYPGLGASPAGTWRMDDVEVVLSPRWREPADDDGENILSKLIISKDFSMSDPRYGVQQPSSARLENGRVKLKGPMTDPRYGYGGVRAGDMIMPSMVLPVIVEDTVIYRTNARIEARDLITGEMKWASNDMPVVRTVARNNQYGYNPTWNRPVENGRYGLTVGSGKVFALADFRPGMMNYNMGVMGQRKPDESYTDNSKLVALDAVTGKCVWEVGRKNGDDEVLKVGKFITPPGYYGGRVYVMIVYLENYHLVCLNADTGALIWKQLVSQAPAVSRNYGTPEDYFHVGTPPVVVDGNVYALTNAGVIAAADAQTGQPLWAYQYEGNIEGYNPMYGYDPNRMKMMASNPIIVARGRVICLPADSKKILALSCSDGAPAWTADRSDKSDLSGIDEDRLAVSGEGLTILSTADGKELFDAKDVRNVVGRPAVTTKAIIASGNGVLYRLTLDNYTLSTVDLSDPTGLLGNLVASDGKLVVANAAGVCAYFKYEVARDRLTADMAKPENASRKIDLMINRAQLAFNAKRFTEAITDYQAAEAASGEGAKNPAIATGLYRSYVSNGNYSEKPEAMIEQFLNAQKYAGTPTEKAQMKLRLAKAYERAGQLTTAAASAQEMAEQFPNELLVDVEVGPKADDQARFGPKDPTRLATVIAKDFLGKLIARHGRACYASFDALAEEEYKKQLAAGNPEALEAVEQRWPNSAVAYDAVFAAAEINYKSALSAGGQDTKFQEQAVRLLTKVSNEPTAPKRVSATVALADIYARQGSKAYVAYLLGPLRELADTAPQTEVAFADVKGKLGEMIKKIDGGNLPKLPAAITAISAIETPLREIFTAADADLFILRDQDYNPIRIGETIAVLQGNRVILANTAANTEKEALANWSGLTTADAATFRQRQMPPATGLVAGLSADGAILAVANHDSVTGLEISTAKIKWRVERMNDVGLSGAQILTIGAGKLVAIDQMGKMTCVDLSNGSNPWQASLRYNRNMGQIGLPQIGGGMVALTYNNMRKLAVYNLDNGKILQEWDANKGCDAMITPDGLLVTFLDGELAVRERDRLDKPLWTRTLPNAGATAAGGQGAGLLAVSHDRIAVVPNRMGTTIEVLPINGGGKVATTLRTLETSGMQSFPVMGAFDASGDLYVACSVQFVNAPRAYASQPIYARQALSLQKFPSDGKGAAWTRTFEVDTQFGGSIIVPLAITAKHVALTVKNNPNMPAAGSSFTYVMDASDGKIVDKINLLGRNGGEGKIDRLRFGGIGPAVVTNGRLSVETLEGVSVYGK